MRLIISAAVLILMWAMPGVAQDFGYSRPCQGTCNEFSPSAPDFNLCRQACDADAACVQWTYSDRGHFNYATDKCFLSSGLTDPIKHECCVSGLKVSQDSTDRADRCRDYATRAIAQNDENLRLRCGLSGPAWSNDRRTHFRWCMEAGPTERRRMSNLRDNQLAQCKGSGGDTEADVCDNYANAAVTEAQQAKKIGCEAKGIEWSTIYTRHYNFCRVASKSERDLVSGQRARALKQCFDAANERTREEDCRVYAEESLQQSAENGRLSCGFEGELWSTRYSKHFNWCLASPRAEVEKARDSRRRALRRCREDSDQGDSDRSEACRDYADQAAGQQSENRRLSCGFRDERWNASPAYHYTWCMTASREERERVARSRTRELAQCREEADSGVDDGACRAYASAAVRDAGQNRALGCGFEGGRWSTDPQVHLNWCRTAPEGARAKEGQRRAELVSLCGSKPKRNANCRSFANLAIAQQRQNLAKGCGFTGPRWHTDYEAHWRWCMDVPGTVRDIEAIARQTAIATCK